MTDCAQKLDKQHQKLEERATELKIENASQENDYTLLMKQLIYYRKQQKQIKEEHTRIKAELDKFKKEEEQTDRMLASKLDKKPEGVGSVHMPTIMRNKKMSDTGANSMFKMLNSSSKGFGF